jgi:hypothetical protein
MVLWLPGLCLSQGTAPSAASPDTKRPDHQPKPTEKPATKPTPKPKTKAKDEPPVVMSADAMARARGTANEGDRYAEPDWDTLPVWRRASFYGIKARGQLFLYVVDCSGSMDDQDRLERAKAELRRSVDALQSPQRFKVIFYNDRPVPMPGDLPKPADYPSKTQLARWLPLVEPFGETDPRSSMALALAFKPDAVFLLSDGAFPEGTVEAVARLNPGKVPIHCVDLANGQAGDGLRKIAADSGGKYVERGR